MSEIRTKVQFVDIDDDMAGQRIDNFLRNQLKSIPKSMVYRILRKGEVRVNKKRIKAEYKLQAGDMVRIPPVTIEEKVEDLEAEAEALKELGDAEAEVDAELKGKEDETDIEIELEKLKKARGKPKKKA